MKSTNYIIIDIKRNENSMENYKSKKIIKYISVKSKRKIIILILFSFGTSDYVNPLIDIKKEKYFEYRLYRQYAIYDRKD